MENTDKIIVLLIVLAAGIATWKMVFDFYKTKFHKIFAHLIAVATASFMFLSSMMLFVPTNYQRGAGPEAEFSITSLLTVIVMVFTLYILFRYLPQRSKDKEEAMKQPLSKSEKKQQKKKK